MKWKSVTAVVVVSLSLAAVAPIASIGGAQRLDAVSAATVHHWKLYQNGVKYYNQGKYKLAIQQLEAAVKQSEQAGYLRKLAQSYEKDKQFQRAADAYYREAKVHEKIAVKSGDWNTYYAVLTMADALNTEVELYAEQAIGQEGSPAAAGLAKFEPATGMYIGAYVDKDSGVEKHGDGKFAKFNELTGKRHAIFFTYHRYGSPFPYHWAAQVKKAGGAIQLAFQPDNGLDKVKDDAYLRKFARDAQAAGVPVFLRFASEMNGSWVKWHGDPALYIEKFRLIATVMKEEAPNVAMVWSPAANPKAKIAEYYPGDNYVDWVGLSMYSVKFFNGDPNSPADGLNPLDSLDYVYKQYAARKPIMVSEYGATHFSKAGNVSVPKFAVTKMNMLYHGAKLKYPRLKAINWFSLNTLTDSHSAERSLNNFSLTENAAVLKAYGQMVANPYYLSEVVSGGASEVGYDRAVTKLASGTKLTGPTTVYVWAKTYDPYIGKIVVKLDGKFAMSGTQYPYAVAIDPAKLAAGAHKLEVVVFDSAGREATRRMVGFRV